MTSRSTQTAKAFAARRQQTRQKLTRVEKAINQLRREHGRLTVRAIAQPAEVSSTFLYENPTTTVSRPPGANERSTPKPNSPEPKRRSSSSGNASQSSWARFATSTR